MIKKLMTSVLGTRHAREVKRLQPVLEQIKQHEERLKDVDEAALKAQTDRFPFEEDLVYNQRDAEGFIKLNALRLRLAKAARK